MAGVIVPVLDSAATKQNGTAQNELVQKLDDLLEVYLERLNEYQRLRKQLSFNLSAGFLSLAQANFTNSSRVRYGQDFYDERMKASRLVAMTVGEQGTLFSVRPCVIDLSTTSEKHNTSHIPSQTASDEKGDESVELKIPEAPAEIESLELPVRSKDPIKWFGILVPQELRKAQANFQEAMDSSVGELASLDAQLHALEIEVRRARKRLAKLN